MRFTKAKIVAAGMILAGICMIAPQQLRAEVPKTQMDGVMGQSIKEEMDDTQISDVDTQRDGLLSTYAMPRLLGASKASSGYTQDFLDGSFTSKVDYTSVTYYHKSDYEDAQLLNGIDVSWWQAKNKKTTALNWEKIHDAGIDFAFVRVASRDTSDGSIYEDTAADSHIQAALENDINVGLYIFSQALTEKEAKQEAEYVLDLADKYGWDVTLPIVIDREKGSHNRLTGGKLSKAKETAVCQSFADTISDAGYQPVVYASYAWIKSYIDTDSLEDCGIWIARYNNTTTSNAKRGEPYVDGQWYHLKAWPDIYEKKDVVGQLDVSILQEKVLRPVLGIEDPRIDQRISFVGGSHKAAELAEIADRTGGVAFVMYPTSMEDLMKIADENKLMPPKSTWFEPKLRSGLFIHKL